MLVCAVTVSVCEVGAAPPAIALNVKAEGLNVKGPVVPPMMPPVPAVTFRVTGAVRTPEGAIMEIVPFARVPAAIPVGLTDTVKVVFAALAAKLPLGEIVSQLLLPQLCSDAWAVAVVSYCAVTVTVCEAGAAPPATALNVKAEGLTVSSAVGTLMTFSVTGTVCVPEAATMEIVPLHVVPVVIPA